MLRTKQVYRNKEDALGLYGLPGGLVAFVLTVAIVTAYTMGVMVGALVGLSIGTVCVACVAGKPAFWFTYHVICFVRGRTVVTAAKPPEWKVEEALRGARQLYESN